MNKREGILVVDDEAAIRKLLCYKLAKAGYHCAQASSGEQALEMMKNNQFELMLLDISMPDISGVEVLKKVRATHPDTAVVMATAITDTDTAIQCMKLGAYDYMLKPFNLDEITLNVNRALEKRRLELENRDYRQNLGQKVTEQLTIIRQTFLNAVASLAYVLEAKDRYMNGHSQRVAETAIAIARNLGLPPEDIEKIKLAGQIHDIGRVGIRESVLNKPGILTEQELQHVQTHPTLGRRILLMVVEDEDILSMVVHHHERYDGKGYPDRLSGEHIPLGARILAVADAYDAMTSLRPYRPAMSIEAALAEIERGRGTQSDPEVASVLPGAIEPQN